MIVTYQESEKQKQKEGEEEGEKEIGEYEVNRKIKNIRVTSFERKCVLRGLSLFTDNSICLCFEITPHLHSAAALVLALQARPSVAVN
jgi:hypothetical protein